MAYPRATLSQKSGRPNYYARVQIPERLREALNKKPNVPMLKSLGTTDRRIANDRLRDKEAEIWREFDRADSVSHPLVIAYMALADAMQVHSITAASEYVEAPERVAEALFHPDDRWDYYEGIRNQAGFVLASDGYGDPEEAMALYQSQQVIQPLMDEFTAQFRKVTTEDYAPKKRTELFADVAKSFYASSQFLDDKSIQRGKTRDDYIASVDKFMRWAGDIDMSNFSGADGRKLLNSYIDEMVDNRVIIPKFRGSGVSASTLNRHIAAVKGVLNYAYTEGTIPTSVWDKYKQRTQQKGYEEVQPISYTNAQLVELLASPKKQREQLLFQLCIGTGCRLDEIALLTWDRICSETIDGVAFSFIDLTGLEVVVKRLASKRKIPLVPAVAACLPPRNQSPFSCKKQPERLFDYPIKKDGKTDAASKAGMRTIRKLFDDPRLTNQSFRHTFVDATKTIEHLLSPQAANYITGHKKEKSERSRYGSAYEIKQLYDAMCLIDFGFLGEDLIDYSAL